MKTEPLPPHIEGSVQAIAELHAQHHHDATRIERIIDRTAGLIGSPGYLGALLAFVALWVVFDEFIGFDPAPFGWLALVLAFVSVVTATLVLISQRRASRLGERREQLTLELSLLAEQKTAKVIGLLEELRRDLPNVSNRVDREARAMAEPADARVVLEVIESTHQALTEDAPPSEDTSGGRSPEDR